jgi:hypothetical protein
MDPLASTAVDSSAWLAFGLSAITALAVLVALIAFGVGVFVVGECRRPKAAGARPARLLTRRRPRFARFDRQRLGVDQHARTRV